MSEQDADAIVVGAGPAGVACAYRLARAGRSVILVERGTAPGSKNVSGSVIWIRSTPRRSRSLNSVLYALATSWERAFRSW